jgi:hypothetical protein
LTSLYSVAHWRMSTKHWWNDTDWGKPKSSERNLSQWCFILHKSHTSVSAVERGLCGDRPAKHRLSRGASSTVQYITHNNTYLPSKPNQLQPHKRQWTEEYGGQFCRSLQSTTRVFVLQLRLYLDRSQGACIHQRHCEMYGFHRGVNETFALLGCYAAFIGSQLLTSRDNL